MLRRFFPKSLYARTALIVILPIFLIQSIVTYVFLDRHGELVSGNLSTTTAGNIALVTRLYQEAENAPARRKLEAYALEHLSLSVRYEPNRPFPDKNKRALFAIYNKTLERALAQNLTNEYWFNTVNWPAYVEIRVAQPKGYLVFFAPREHVYVTTGPIFVAWLAGASALIGWVAILFLRNQVRSILRLASAAEDFGRGRDAPGFRPAGATEVRRAGRAFIAMRQRIRRHMDQRTTMLAGVSHDLKTPLTRLKLALALLPKQTPDKAAMSADIDEMERMVDAYLDFARDVSAEDAPDEIDLAAFGDEIREDARRAGDTLELEIFNEKSLNARRASLKRALMNLVGNGFKHSENVRLTIQNHGVYAEFIVDDDGPGISSEQYEEAFKPFARLDPARSVKTGGVGLGLTLVRDVARSHGGDACLEPSPMGGLRAVMRIPY